MLVVQPDFSRAPVLDIINGAMSSLDLVIYEMDDVEVINAMLNAVQRGVKVRAIFDIRSRHFIPNPNPATMEIMAAGGIEVKEAPYELFNITHQKTLVADNAVAMIMGFNLCSNYFEGTRDFGVVTTDPDEVWEIAYTFEADWNGRSSSHDGSSLVWSPDNARQKLTELIDSAESALDIYTLLVSDKGILSALSAAAQRGVRVRLIAARLMEGGKDVNEKGLELLRAAGVQAKSMESPFVHGKMIMADYGSAVARVYVGSQNFSASSLDRNRELGVITENRNALRDIQSTFESDWGSIK